MIKYSCNLSFFYVIILIVRYGDSMKLKNIIKKQTTIIAIAVVLVATAALGVSYAIFFDVSVSSENQVITAGNLRLTVSGVTSITLSEPIATSAGLTSTPVNYTIVNTNSNLPAAYSIYLYADTGNVMGLDKIKISTDGNASAGSTAKVLSSITDTLTENSKTYYKISSGTLAAGASGSTNYLRLWVDEDLVTDEISDVAVNINMYIVTEVNESATSFQ